MTVIVFDGEILVSDSATFVSRTQVSSTTNKIKHYPYGSEYIAYAGAGTVTEFQQVIEWLASDDKEKDRPYFEESQSHFIAITNKYDCHLYFCDQKNGFEKVILPYCIGSGFDHAITALDCGLDPVGAVKMAMKRNAYCGGDHVNYLYVKSGKSGIIK